MSHGLSREEQIRRFQETMEDPKDQSYHFQSVNQTYQGGGGNAPGAVYQRPGAKPIKADDYYGEKGLGMRVGGG